MADRTLVVEAVDHGLAGPSSSTSVVRSLQGRASRNSRSVTISGQRREATMKIHRLYADEKGESHWQDVEIEFKEQSRAGRMSARLPASGIIFPSGRARLRPRLASRAPAPVHHQPGR